MADNTNKIVRSYIKGAATYILGLTTVGIAVMMVFGLTELLWPLVVCTVYCAVIEIVDIYVWQRVRRQSPGNMTTFYMGVGMVRFLTVLALAFGYRLIAGKETMLAFITTLAAYYLTLLIHHTKFFGINPRQ